MITKTWLEKMQSRLCLTALSALGLTLVPALADASVAGHVQFVAGDVRVVDAAGKAHIAQKGQEINEGETVFTAAGSSAQLKMIDGGILALRPETELKVDTYVFHGAQDGSENALLSLLKGGLRTITGLIGQQNKEKLKLRTPTAVIGIRGTDHEPIVLIEPTLGTPAANPPSNPPGTYDKVNVGATSLTTQVGTAVIGPNQVGYAASLTQAPVLLPKLPDFYRATPTPLAKIDQKHQEQAGTSQSSSEGATPGASAAAASNTDAKTEAASVAPVVPVSELTAVDADGNVLNLSQQTLTTASGQVQALGANTTISSGGNPGSGSSSGSGSSGTSGTPVTAAAGSLLLISFPVAQSAAGAIPQFFSLGGAGLSLSNDATGNLTAASLSGNFDASDSSGAFSFGTGAHFSLSQSGSTLVNFGSNAATGLAWGRWQGGTITESGQNYGQDASGNWGLGANSSGTFVIGDTQTQSVDLGSGSLHWISAANPTPYYLPLVLTGTANYTLVGGTNPTDQNGNVGTLNSASLGVNFTTQVVNAGVNFTVAGNNWVMQSGPMLLDGAQFSTYSNCASTQCTNNVSLTKNGVLTSSTPSGASSNVNYSIGNLSGFLTGAGLNGAALEYSVQDVASSVVGPGVLTVSNAIQGVAAFSGPTQDVTTPFRVVGIDDGWNNLSNLISNTASTTYNYAPSYHGNITGSEQPVASVVESAAGLTSFIGQASGYTAANSSVTVPGPSGSGPLNTINVGTAVNTDLGSTTIGGTTISWGRWAGGTVDIYSLDGSTLLGTIDNSNRSIHWVTSSSVNNTLFNLPLTGTATYTLAGNTDPTDYKGNTGTLNSATLSANFANATVNTSINVSFNAANNTSTWNLTANNVPFSSNSGFKSDVALNGSNGIVDTVTCTGSSCAGSTRGYVEGHFIAGAQGAILFYGMSTGNIAGSGSSSGTSISTFTPTNGVTGLIVMKH